MQQTEAVLIKAGVKMCEINKQDGLISSGRRWKNGFIKMNR